MAFIIDKDGNYIPVLGTVSGGGGGGTSDHSQLTNLDYASSGHTGFLSSANYLPQGTTIDVKLDGSGDFTNLVDAFNFLTDKWSDANIIFNLGAGTFEVSETLHISTFRCNIPRIDIVGVSTTDTIIDHKISSQWTPLFNINNNGHTRIRNLKITGPCTKTSGGYTGVSVNKFSMCEFANVVTDGLDRVIETSMGGNALVNGSMTISNCPDALFAKTGTIVVYGSAVSFNNVTTAFSVNGGGIIQKFEGSANYSSVTNIANVTANIITSNGIIMGSFN